MHAVDAVSIQLTLRAETSYNKACKGIYRNSMYAQQWARHVVETVRLCSYDRQKKRAKKIQKRKYHNFAY